MGNSSGGGPALGTETGNGLYHLLAKRVNLDHQKSLPTNPYPYWPGRDIPSSMAENPPSPHSKLLSSMVENPHPQNVDLISILQGLSDRASPPVNNGVPGWSKFPFHSDKLELHHGQTFPPPAFGISQPRLQPQAQQPSLTNLLSQAIDTNPSSLLAQDPQILTMLHQQQYLMQLNSQASIPSPPLSALDKLLLLKQQQKQEELLRQQHQHQQLLSQVLSEQHSNLQRFSDPSFVQLQAISAANNPVDHSRLQLSHELLPFGSQMPVPNVQEERSTSFVNLPPQVPTTCSAEPSSMSLPHQMFGSTNTQLNHLGPSSMDAIAMDMSLKEPLVFQKTVVASEPLENALKRDESVITSVPFEDALKTANPAMLSNSDAFVSEEMIEKGVEETSTEERANNFGIQLAIGGEGEKKMKQEQCSEEPVVKEVRNLDLKKGSERKSRKQKAKGVSKQTKQSEDDVAKCEPLLLAGEVPSLQKKKEEKSGTAWIENIELSQPERDEVETTETKGGMSEFVGSVSQQSTQNRAWKPAPGVKPKSLVEIQQEEQRKAQIMKMDVSEIATSFNSMNLSTAPWAGVIASSDFKADKETHQDGSSLGKQSSLNSKSNKSQLHDLLAEEVLAKSNEKDSEVVESIYTQPDLMNDDNFIEAKDTKKSRKKSAKAKAVGSKPVASVTDVAVGSLSVIEKGKSSQKVQLAKEISPQLPSGPSLGDFVVWKGEAANPTPIPAWSTDSAKIAKPTSLRDILKEQGKRSSSVQTQMTPQQKSLSTQGNRASNPTWSSPSKVAPSIPIGSNASAQTKYKGDDDLFWGPLEQSSKLEAKQYVSTFSTTCSFLYKFLLFLAASYFIELIRFPLYWKSI